MSLISRVVGAGSSRARRPELAVERVSRRGLLAAGTGGGLAAAGGIGATLWSPAASAASPPRPEPYARPWPHLTEAVRLTEYLRLADPLDAAVNDYLDASDRSSTVLAWGDPGRPSTCRALAQCSTFVTGALMRAYGTGTDAGWATSEYFRATFFPTASSSGGKWSPSAAEYQRGFAALDGASHLVRVTRPADLVPGDLVAINYRGTSSASGHIVMIRRARGVIAHRADGGLGVAADGHVFEIVDCTGSPHGDPNGGNLALYEAFPDTRFEATRDAAGNRVKVRHGRGVGFGHMVLYAARTDGAFAGYRWSVNSSTVHSVGTRPITAARIAGP